MNRLFVFLVVFIVFLPGISKADAFIVRISLTEGEHSKDSWSCETSIVVEGSTVSYTKIYSGHRTKSQNDVSKSCNLTDDQVTAIQTFIKDKGMLRSDSLIDSSEKYKSYEQFVNASIFIAVWESISRISMNGDVSNLQYEPLYTNIYGLVDMIRGYAENCN